MKINRKRIIFIIGLTALLLLCVILLNLEPKSVSVHASTKILASKTGYPYSGSDNNYKQYGEITLSYQDNNSLPDKDIYKSATVNISVEGKGFNTANDVWMFVMSFYKVTYKKNNSDEFTKWNGQGHVLFYAVAINNPNSWSEGGSYADIGETFSKPNSTDTIRDKFGLDNDTTLASLKALQDNGKKLTKSLTFTQSGTYNIELASVGYRRGHNGGLSYDSGYKTSWSIRIDNEKPTAMAKNSSGKILSNNQIINENFVYEYETIDPITNEENILSVTKDGRSLSYNSGDVLSEEGVYIFTLTDVMQNSITQTYIIDKTAPIPTFSGTSVGGIYRTTNVTYVSDTIGATISSVNYTKHKLVASTTEFYIGEILEKDISFSSGKTFNSTGFYLITIIDNLGNKSTTELCIISDILRYNYGNLTTTGYQKPNNYKVNIPYFNSITIPQTLKTGTTAKYPGTYNNTKTYLFENYNNALSFMKEIETQNCVYVQSNTFQYKAYNNPNIMGEYSKSSEGLLNLEMAIEKYSKPYVFECGEIKLNSSVYLDSTFIVLDKGVLDNTSSSIPLIHNDFEYKTYTKILSAGDMTNKRLIKTYGTEDIFTNNHNVTLNDKNYKDLTWSKLAENKDLSYTRILGNTTLKNLNASTEYYIEIDGFTDSNTLINDVYYKDYSTVTGTYIFSGKTFKNVMQEKTIGFKAKSDYGGRIDLQIKLREQAGEVGDKSGLYIREIRVYLLGTATYEYRTLTKITFSGSNNLSGTITKNTNLVNIFPSSIFGQGTITEYDSLGNSYSYQVVVDNIAPVATVEYERYDSQNWANISGWKNRIITTTINLSAGTTLGFYNLKSLSLTNLSDTWDKYIMAQVTLPDGTTIITRDVTLLTFGENKNFTLGGEYKIQVYDRSNNVLEVQFAICMDKPRVLSTIKGSGDTKRLILEFANGSTYNSIKYFKIYRYDTALPFEGEYQEKVDEVVINTISVSQNIWTYTLYLGGNYTIYFVDEFNRVTISDVITLNKGLPSYTLDGVDEDGKTNKTVTLLFYNTTGYQITQDGVSISGYSSIDKDQTKITIPAGISTNGYWSIKLYRISDPNTYLTINFWIDTIAPIISVVDEGLGDLIWGTIVNHPFIIKWDKSESVNKIRYSINGGTRKTYEESALTDISSSYRLGNALSEDGVYSITVTDDVGNTNEYSMQIDSMVDYKIEFDDKTLIEESGATRTNSFFILSAKENLNLTIYRDEELLEGIFGTEYVEEGTYRLIIKDFYSNVKELSIIIDKSAPSVTINNRENEYSSVVLNLDPKDIISLKVKHNELSQVVELSNELTFTKWGDYSITVKDALENSATFNFTILKSAPIVSIYDINGDHLEDGSTINKGAYFTWDDDNATAKISINGSLKKTYLQNSLIDQEGTIVVQVTDEAKNQVSVSITIVKIVKFSFITAKGDKLEPLVVGDEQKTNLPFTIELEGENLSVDVLKNGEPYKFIPGETINTSAIYSFRVYDSIGNEEIRLIEFDNIAPQLTFTQTEDLTKPVNVNCDISDVEKITLSFKAKESNQLVIAIKERYVYSDWGEYSIEAMDALGNTTTITFTINKVPPEIKIETLSGKRLQSGDKVNESIIILYEDDAVVKYSIDNGITRIYSNNMILSEQGTYTITIIDVCNNSETFNITLDNEIKLKAIMDGTTIKDFTQAVIGKRYFEITLGEKFQIDYFLNNVLMDAPTETIFRIDQEGEHKLEFVDEVGNCINIIFTLDRTAPKVMVDTSSEITKNDVIFTIDDMSDINEYKVVKDGIKIKGYILSKNNSFSEEGKYEITVEDALGNKILTTFSIKRSIAYKLSLPSGFITDDEVSLQLKEKELTLVVFMNGEEVLNVVTEETLSDYAFETAGNYAITITDSLGNIQELIFTIDETKYRKNFDFNIPLDTKITLLKDNVEVYLDPLISGDILSVTEDGNYILIFEKDGKTSEYNFIIDTIIPTLFINGKEYEVGESVGKLNKDFTLESSKEKSTLTVYYNGKVVEYNKGDKINAAGKYRVVIEDEVGNIIEWEFEKKFTLNAGSILLIVVVVVLFLLVVVLIIRRKIKMKIK